MAAKAPIIVIKKKGGHGGHHGGAWKVAYADFVTAMMSLFIVLWLMSSSEKVKKAVAGYFQDPKGTSTLMGTTMTGTGEAIPVATKQDLDKLKEKLEKEIQANPELKKLSKQIEMTITPEGLRIELIEDKNGTFYESGSAHLSDTGQELLALLATELKKLPNNLLIEGHTDAAKYSTDANYSNWELSADRANSARRLMQADGVRQDQVTQVRGYADQLLRVKNNPYDASNRRISILVKNQEGPLDLKGAGVADNSPPAPPANAKPSEGEHKPGEGGAKPAEAEHKTDSHAPAPAAATPPAQKAGTAPSAQPAAKPAAGTGIMGKIKSLLPGKK
jgi:chemotaxis protein MotB